LGLTNTQYEELMRAYSRRQSEDLRDRDRRVREAYARIPGLEQLEGEISSLAVSCALSRMDHSSAGEQEAHARREALIGQRRRLLRAAGFPEDQLQMRYTCPDCQDTGMAGGRECHCFRQAAVRLLQREAGLDTISEDESFSHFRLDFYPDDLIDPATGVSSRQHMQEILEQCQSFARPFKPGARNLLFYGDTGLGKTFLSHCIAREVTEQSCLVICCSASELFDQLASETFRRPGGGVSWDYILDCDLLILDDMGTELTNTFVASALFRIINSRLEDGRSTIISTNLRLPDFNQLYSERITSRITSHYELMKFYGRDIRIRRKLSSSVRRS